MKIFHDKLKISAQDSTTKRRKRRDGIQHNDIQLIPEDIIMDILSRLPIHSLFQCTLVSKAWRDMIVHNPIFATMQHNRALENQNNTLLMFSHVNSPEVNLYLVEREAAGLRKLRVMDAKLTDHTCFNDRPEILGSCNGLLCISFYRGHRVYISNPITGECKKLPSKERSCDALVIGIGFDSARKEYKVVRRVFIHEKPFSQKIEIHTLGTSSWRQVVNFPWSDRRGSLNDFSDVLVNGSLHWCSRHQKPLHITSLDMSDEQFGVVPTPELTSRGDIHLMAWKGFLTMTQQLWVDNSMHVWVMKEYNVKESWTKQINVTMPTWLFGGVNYWPFDDDTLVDDIRAFDHPRLGADSRTFCGLGVMAHTASLVSLKKYRGRGKVGRMKFLPIQ
ncbi:F-box-like protein [Cinnamomum micranthum f. kanehirae]|uniref:F-box-like protein n=1 Tax=Cinnamomum micranthum f. kanehirae TaxID=337451 RepID=A0A3S4PIS7_9MAGN|nr:F-box-like protein [Cinnamomum micranthum f. kanehirae]